jgi:CheY-like chemotaxis protein
MKKVKSILLVDDDSTSNFMAQLLLEDLNVAEQINTTLNGQEALDYIQIHCTGDTCPNLILLDINMPVMNGFEFLEHFRQLPVSNKIQVVMLTSSVYHKDMEKAKDYQINHYISKPLTTEKLQEIFSGF